MITIYNNYLFHFILLFFSIFQYSCNENDIIEDVTKISINPEISIEDISFSDSLNGILCGGVKDNYGVIYKTNDGGSTWNLVYETSDKLYTIYIKNRDSLYVAGDSMTVVYSIDAGLNWDISYSSLYNGYWTMDRSNIRGISFFENGNLLTAGRRYTSSGVVYSFDLARNSRINIQTSYCINDITKANDKYYAVGYGAIIEIDSELNLRYETPSDDNFMDICETGKYIYVCGYNGSIYRKENDWINQKESNPVISTSREHLLSICFLNNDTGFCGGEKGLLYFTEDGGQTWSKKDLGSDAKITSICHNNYSFFIGNDKGEIQILSAELTSAFKINNAPLSSSGKNL